MRVSRGQYYLSAAMSSFTWSSGCSSSNRKRKTGVIFRSCCFTNFLITHYLFLLLIFNVCCSRNDNNNIIEESMPKLWETLLPAEIYYSSPSLSIDEKTIYIGTSLWLTGNHRTGQVFVAIDAATGKEKWRLQLGANEVRSSPAVAADNSIFLAVELRNPPSYTALGDELWHLSPDGVLLWKYNINPRGLTMEVGLSSPAIGLDGTIYVAGDRLYAIRPDGTLRWSAFDTFPEMFRNAPVIGKDGTLYFVYHNIPLTALNPDNGSVIWSCPLGVNDHCLASPAIGPGGTIYAATQPGLLYAVSPEGSPLWTFDLANAGFSGTLRSSPAIDAEGSVYFGINTGNPSSAFFALNSDGTLKWKFEPSDLPDDVPSTHFDIYSSPALGSDGGVYFGQEFGRVYSLKSSDGSLIGMATTNSGITWSSPAIDSKGVLYISDLSGRVYAFQTGSNGLSVSAAWPKFRSDNQNIGRKR
jgi:outer membrane protein assembly factor BamB